MQSPAHRPKAEPGGQESGGDPDRAYRRPDDAPRSPRLTLDRTVRVLVGVGVAAGIGWVLWYFANLVVYLVVGILLSYLMRPLVDRLQGFGLGRIPAIFATFVLVFGGLTVLVTELVPFMARQVSELSEQLAPGRAAEVVDYEGGGSLRVGETIVGVEGDPWENVEQLRAAAAKQEGEEVTLLVEDRDGARREVRIPVRAAPGSALPDAEAAAADERLHLSRLGLTVREVTVSAVATALERRLRAVVPVEPGTIIRSVSGALDRLLREERLTQLAGSVVGVFTDIIYAIVVIPFVAFFGLKDGTKIRHGLLRLVPNRYFEITLAIVEKVETILGRYFKALLVQCVAVATLSAALLTVVGLDYAVFVGFFAGLANTIPYFGPLIGFVLGTAVGIVQAGDLSLVPGVIVAMGLTRLADDVVFQPFLFSRAAQMHPLVILFVVLMGAQLAGLVGMLLAIPVTTMVRVVAGQVVWSMRNYRILQNL